MDCCKECNSLSPHPSTEARGQGSSTVPQQHPVLKAEKPKALCRRAHCCSHAVSMSLPHPRPPRCGTSSFWGPHGRGAARASLFTRCAAPSHSPHNRRKSFCVPEQMSSEISFLTGRYLLSKTLRLLQHRALFPAAHETAHQTAVLLHSHQSNRTRLTASPRTKCHQSLHRSRH